MASIQNVLVRAVALTDRGKLDPGPIRDLVVDRLARLNYTVVTDPSEPYDVVFRVKCEQYKTWEGTAQHGGDADLPDAPARLGGTFSSELSGAEREKGHRALGGV